MLRPDGASEMPPTYSIDITKPSPQDRYQRRLGAGITPQTITAVLRDADLGNMWGYADLLDEIRQGDPHLHGDLTKRELTVSGADYEVRLPTTATTSTTPSVSATPTSQPRAGMPLHRTHVIRTRVNSAAQCSACFSPLRHSRWAVYQLGRFTSTGAR